MHFRSCIFACLIMLLLASCSAPMSEADARATATVTGCWPYGVFQPRPTVVRTATPTPLPTQRSTPTVIGPTAIPAPQTPTSGLARTDVPLIPTCIPLPGTPTVTPKPTVQPTLRPVSTPHPPAPIGGRTEVGDLAGIASPWGRMVRTPAVAIHPVRRTAVVAFLNWGSEQGDAGNVWVRVQQPGGSWGDLQSINIAPVATFLGGLGVTQSREGVITVTWGAGGEEFGETIWMAQSRDDGATWSDPAVIPEISGSVRSLTSDFRGGLHMLAVASKKDGNDAYYAYLAPGASAWQVSRNLTGTSVFNGELGLLEQADGSIRRVVFLNGRDERDDTHLMVLMSADGAQWTRHTLETGRYFSDEQVTATSLLAVPRGAGLIAVAWGQTPGPGHSRSGSFVQVSTDGGATWSREEIMVMHTSDGEIAFEGDVTHTRGGFEPSLVYDATTDQIVASWVEDDFSRRDHQWGAHIRTLVAVRKLTTAEWTIHLTPENVEQIQPPILADWGWRGALWGTPDGMTHFATFVDERNAQQRIVVQPMRLSFLVSAATS